MYCTLYWTISDSLVIAFLTCLFVGYKHVPLPLAFTKICINFQISNRSCVNSNKMFEDYFEFESTQISSSFNNNITSPIVSHLYLIIWIGTDDKNPRLKQNRIISNITGRVLTKSEVNKHILLIIYPGSIISNRLPLYIRLYYTIYIRKWDKIQVKHTVRLNSSIRIWHRLFMHYSSAYDVTCVI